MKARFSSEAWQKFIIASDPSKSLEEAQQAVDELNAMPRSQQLVEGYQNPLTLDERTTQTGVITLPYSRTLQITELQDRRFQFILNASAVPLDSPADPDFLEEAA